MSETLSAEAAPPAREEPPRRSLEQAYGRTWELELLISGVVTFALLQLPAAVDRGFWRLDAVTSGLASEAVGYGYLYAKVMLYALTGGFLLHLGVRAFWVGLIGLDTVFPRGVRWERLDYGPVTRDYYRETHRSLRALARTVDRFCSVIFSVAFFLVIISVVSVMIAAVVGVVSIALATLVFGADRLGSVYTAVFWGVIGPLMAVPMADRLLRDRDPGPGVRRVLRGGTRVAYFALLGPAYVPMLNVLLSNLNRRLTNAVLLSIFVGLFGFHLVKDQAVPRGRIGVDGYAFLPVDAGRLGVDPRYYESLGGGDLAGGPVPSIQADIVREPFVRLFVPYLPDLHSDAIRERCPGVEPLQETGLRWRARNAPLPPAGRAEAVLACLARVQPVHLNGARLEDPGFRFFTHPETGIRGVVAYLPTAGLPAGENLLVVDRVAPAGEGDAAPPPHHIPFWVSRPAEPSPGS